MLKICLCCVLYYPISACARGYSRWRPLTERELHCEMEDDSEEYEDVSQIMG